VRHDGNGCNFGFVDVNKMLGYGARAIRLSLIYDLFCVPNPILYLNLYIDTEYGKS
jgi:prepilin-type processing-associated H-X9-DG protein